MKGKTILYSMLVFVPVSFWLGLTHASPVAVFVVSCLAILPLAGLMGEATEHLAHHTGPGVGGLLNATFGNAAELIIAFMALRAGETEIVKASLTGSIIGNMLMVLGLSMLLGGWKHKELRFNRLAAETRQQHDGPGGGGPRDPRDLRDRHPPPEPRAHRVDQPRHLLDPDPHLRREPRLLAQEPPAPLRARGRDRPTRGGGGRAALVGRRGACSCSLAAAVLVGFVSEFLVHAVDAAGPSLGLRQGLHGRRGGGGGRQRRRALDRGAGGA